MNIQNWIRKPVAFIATLAIIIGSLAVPGENTGQVFATDEPITATVADARDAIDRVAGYYNGLEDKSISDWEALLSILAVNDLSPGAIDLGEFQLPATGTTGTYANILLELLKGYYPTAWINELLEEQNTTTGAFSTNANDHAWAMLTLRAAGALDPEKEKLAAEYLLSCEFVPSEGGFKDSWGYASLDVTGVASMALAGWEEDPDLGVSVSAIRAYLISQQSNDGGYGSYGTVNGSTTSYVVNGLAALGADPFAVVTGASLTPIDSLLSFQNPDGSFFYPESWWNPEGTGEGTVDPITTKQAPQAFWSAINGTTAQGSAYNTLLVQNAVKARTISISVTSDNGTSTILPSQSITAQTTDSVLTLRHAIETVLGKNDRSAVFQSDKVASISGIETAESSRWYVLVDGVEKYASHEISDNDVIEVRQSPDNTVAIDVVSTSGIMDLTSVSMGSAYLFTVNADASEPGIKVGTDPLPQIAVIGNNANGIRLLIPHGTTVTSAGADWDGTIALPTTTTVALSGKTVRSAIAVGAVGHDLAFDQPIRLLLPGAGDKKVGFIDRNGTFTEITQTLTTDTVNGAATELEAAGKGEGKIRSGSDLAVWTNHFTTFVTYDDAVSGGSGSQPSTATLKVYGYDGTRSTTMLGTTTLEIGSRDTPISLLDKAGLDYTNQGGYIAAIEGLEEREHGSDSGWKYSVNGTFPSAGASSYILKAGDAVVWRYVTALNEGEVLGGALPTGAAITEAAVTSASIAEVLARFNDLDPGAWYGPSVGTLVMKGILAGQSETRFAPMQDVTRAEFAMILAKAAGADLAVERTYGFIDGKADEWFVPAVAWAREAGIVSGFGQSDGTYAFRPQEVIRRQDMAVMLQKFLVLQTGKAPAAVKEPVAFRDENAVAAYAKEAVAAMQRAGIINGSPGDGGLVFRPGDSASRAEAAVMVHFALKTSGLLEDK